MNILYTTADIKKKIASLKQYNKSVGFVPTMGALHRGHISLLTRSKMETDVSVVSIFVNPSQFNNDEDYTLYPRTIEEDLNVLEQNKCDIVFIPSENEMYPEKDTRIFDLKPLDEIMEGRYRPGHFNGVAQIVTKLFDIVMPDKAFFGIKDFQQLAIIKKLVDDLHYDIKIISCPIIREKNGLAMSSRNNRLSETEKEHASRIYKVLSESKKMAPHKTIPEIKEWVLQEINSDPYLEVEYFEFVNDPDLKRIKDWDVKEYIYGCIAVYVGKVRLIDNVNYNYL